MWPSGGGGGESAPHSMAAGPGPAEECYACLVTHPSDDLIVHQYLPHSSRAPFSSCYLVSLFSVCGHTWLMGLPRALFPNIKKNLQPPAAAHGAQAQPQTLSAEARGSTMAARGSDFLPVSPAPEPWPHPHSTGEFPSLYMGLTSEFLTSTHTSAFPSRVRLRTPFP